MSHSWIKGRYALLILLTTQHGGQQGQAQAVLRETAFEPKGPKAMFSRAQAMALEGQNAHVGLEFFQCHEYTTGPARLLLLRYLSFGRCAEGCILFQIK